jgi:hypothetical protein
LNQLKRLKLSYLSPFPRNLMGVLVTTASDFRESLPVSWNCHVPDGALQTGMLQTAGTFPGCQLEKLFDKGTAVP